MVHFLLLVSGVAAAAAATCLADPPIFDSSASSAAPAVTIQNGTVIGSKSGAIDSFKGIPFAQPPIGALRLKPPQTIISKYGTINATSTPTACPQLSRPGFNASSLPTGLAAVVEKILEPPEPQGEDCLTLNVYRPSDVTPCSRLPVGLWIYGGGWETGSTQAFDGTSLVNKSIQLGQPMVFVSMNYRLGGFGFLAGKEIQNDGSTNLGMRDQRLAMQWVSENIEQFGGDPLKVTLFGESAGSISTLDHMVINKGNNHYHGEPLFRGAIMDSGSTFPAQSVASSKAQAVYDQVVAAANCSSHPDTLSCLRDLPYPQFRTAIGTIPDYFGYQSLDIAYIPRFDPNDDFFSEPPEVSISCGNFAKVPIIIGDQEDEGTLFSLSQFNISSSEELIEYFMSYYPETGRQVLADMVAKYSDDPSAGSPFRTGNVNEVYPQYKRLAAILGDLFFQWPRRKYLSTAAAQVPAWSYVSSYLYGTPVTGTFHGTDILGLFGEGVGLLSAEVIDSVQTYYISFINHLDPNAFSGRGVMEAMDQPINIHEQLVIGDDSVSNLEWFPNWPRYDESKKELLNFRNESNRIITDDFRQKAFEYYANHVTDFRL